MRDVVMTFHPLILPFRKRYVKMRESLVRFRSLVHMYVNRKQYIKVREPLLQQCFSILLLWIEVKMFSV